MARADQDMVVLTVDQADHDLPPAPAVLGPTAAVKRVVGDQPYVEVLGYPSWAMVQREYNSDELDRAGCAVASRYDRLTLSVGPLGLGAIVAGAKGVIPLVFRHWADTLLGTSGGPILDIDTGAVLGVHTCAGDGPRCPNVTGLLDPPTAADEAYQRFNVGWNTSALCAYRPARCR